MRSRILLVAVAAAALVACATENLSPAPRRTSEALPLGWFTTEWEADVRDQALGALERDARRRAARFQEVVNPGFLFGSTRVPQGEIDAGLWSPRELYQLGGQLFHQRFRREDGFGAADLPPLGRFQRGLRGGPDATQCADCHRRGGLAGAGDASDNAYPYGDGERPDASLERNPVSLAGAGVLELVAREITRDLEAQRAALFARATDEGKPIRGELASKGLSFGAFTARPDGTVDATEVTGVDPDLVVRPFGWKGHTASLREFIESELATHHGMQSEHLVQHAAEEVRGSGALPDPDGDGVIAEITEGQVTALTAFVAMQEVPTSEPPVLLKEQDQPNVSLMPDWLEGAQRFESVGCATCHVPELSLKDARYVLQGRGGAADLTFDLAREAAAPRLTVGDDGRFVVRAFTDFKRHDMGPALADAFPERGRGPAIFLTPPLWGIARSRPYLHDGRAPTLEAAILMHGGEAQASRDAYANLSEHERATVRVFLTSLTRARRFAVP